MYYTHVHYYMKISTMLASVKFIPVANFLYQKHLHVTKIAVYLHRNVEDAGSTKRIHIEYYAKDLVVFDKYI